MEGFGTRYLPYAQPPVTATTVKVALDESILDLPQDTSTSIRGDTLELTRGVKGYVFKSGNTVPLQNFRR